MVTRSLFPAPPSLRRIHEVMREVQAIEVDDEAYHRIALDNLLDPQHVLERAWRVRYHQPPKPLADYTVEELYVEALEDHYAAHPKEADARRLVHAQGAPVVFGTAGAEWDGRLPDEVERARQAYWERRRAQHPHTQVDLTRFQSDVEMTPEKARAYLAQVGQTAPAAATPDQAAGEFEEEF